MLYLYKLLGHIYLNVEIGKPVLNLSKKKLGHELNLLRLIKFTINQKFLETIFFAYICSLLEYADILWDNCTQQQCNELEKKSSLKLDVLSLLSRALLKLINSLREGISKNFSCSLN